MTTVLTRLFQPQGAHSGALKAAKLERELMQHSRPSSGGISPENNARPPHPINMKLPQAEMTSNMMPQMTHEQVGSTRAELQYGWSPRKVPPIPSNVGPVSRLGCNGSVRVVD
jgi:hypothetical protein